MVSPDCNFTPDHQLVNLREQSPLFVFSAIPGDPREVDA